jgi:hypothetical protein
MKYKEWNVRKRKVTFNDNSSEIFYDVGKEERFFFRKVWLRGKTFDTKKEAEEFADSLNEKQGVAKQEYLS